MDIEKLNNFIDFDLENFQQINFRDLEISDQVQNHFEPYFKDLLTAYSANVSLSGYLISSKYY